MHERLFDPLKYKKINFLEIGVRGYDDPYSDRFSVFIWKSYFHFAQLFSMDIEDKARFSGGRTKVFQGPQEDKGFLKKVAREVGQFDIIIDDGSHINQHQIDSFKTLFPFLKDGGIHIIEDIQTSYWPSFGGGNLKTEEYEKSCIRFFLGLVDGLNYGEYLNEIFFLASLIKNS